MISDSSSGEQQFKADFRKKLLELLLQKHENSKAFASGKSSRIKPQLAIGKSPFQADYEDEMDFFKREWIHEEVRRLGDMAIITYTWAKYREGEELDKVYLNPNGIPAAYEMIGRKPKDAKMDELCDVLSPLADHPWEWVKAWANEAVVALRERKSASLDLNDPDSYRKLVSVLFYLTQQTDDVPKRVMSQRLFHDSKVFERTVEQRLLQVLRSVRDMEFESNADALASVGVTDHPKNVLVAGWLDGTVVGRGDVVLARFPGGVGLSGETIRALEIRHLPAERIILIENLTSWHQWVAERREEKEFVIYTGGFPNRTVQLLLRKLADFLNCHSEQSIPVCHWGDMDVGGIRIFEFIRGFLLPQLVPIGMDEAWFERYVDVGMDISESYTRKIDAHLADERFSAWYGLLRLMKQTRKRIEQEAVSDLPIIINHKTF